MSPDCPDPVPTGSVLSADLSKSRIVSAARGPEPAATLTVMELSLRSVSSAATRLLVSADLTPVAARSRSVRASSLDIVEGALAAGRLAAVSLTGAWAWVVPTHAAAGALGVATGEDDAVVPGEAGCRPASPEAVEPFGCGPGKPAVVLLASPDPEGVALFAAGGGASSRIAAAPEVEVDPGEVMLSGGLPLGGVLAAAEPAGTAGGPALEDGSLGDGAAGPSAVPDPAGAVPGWLAPGPEELLCAGAAEPCPGPAAGEVGSVLDGTPDAAPWEGPALAEVVPDDALCPLAADEADVCGEAAVDAGGEAVEGEPVGLDDEEVDDEAPDVDPWDAPALDEVAAGDPLGPPEAVALEPEPLPDAGV